MKYFLTKKKAAMSILVTLLTVSSCVPKDETTDSLEDSQTENTKPPENVGDGDNQEEDLTGTASTPVFEARGVGGGGAMSGFSISPYSTLWFVGTDMGTLFRSVNKGKTWIPINHFQTTYSSDLDSAAGVGFSSDPMVAFHAPAGRTPVRTEDAGETWKKITSFALASGEKIKYWRPHTYNEKYAFAGTTNGLWITSDKGFTWKKLSGVSGDAKGTYIDYLKDGFIIYHATATGIYKSVNEGSSFSPVYNASGVQIRAFTAGRDNNKITFAFVDNDGKNACASANKYLSDWGQTSLNNHYANCGYVWTGDEKLEFTKTKQEAGDHLKMAENNSDVIYATGSTAWIRQYGTKVWKTTDAGKNWSVKLNQIDYDNNYKLWGEDKIQHSGVAIDIGWHDGGYESFDINLRSADTVGGTGYYFLHTSQNGGNYWDAPFTEYADSGPKAKGKFWRSTGLEVTTVYRLKFHPNYPNITYAAMADVGGMASEDGGKSFRLSKAHYNSNYDYAFDPSSESTVYAASGSQHDYPMNWHANAAENDEGGIFKSTNKGRTWTRLTGASGTFNRQFLSVGFDHVRKYLYGGLHGTGIARSTDGGASWGLFNTGLPSGALIIPQIEVDPNDGGVYAMVSGNAPNFTNQASTGIYYLAPNATSWKLLRGTVRTPSGVSSSQALWYYPTGFAVDFSNGSNRNTLYLVDYENNKNWLATGIWKSTDRGNTWERQEQFTHPLTITLDHENPNRAYVNGLYTMDGSWGNGGLYYTNNGQTWEKNTASPFQANGRTATIDPNDTDKIFYGYFGSALLYGERP